MVAVICATVQVMEILQKPATAAGVLVIATCVAYNLALDVPRALVI